MVRRFVVGAAIAATACACAAVPAQAANVTMLADIRMASMPMVYFTADPGEANDIEVTIEENLAHPKAVRIVDRGATLTTSGTAGSCTGSNSCWAPCRLESPHEALCTIEDAYGPTDPAAEYPRFSWFDGQLEDGGDKFTTLPGVSLYSKVRDTDGNDHYRLGGGGEAGAGTGDVVEFGNPTATGRVTAGGGTVLARDGGQQTITCYTYDWGRVEKDPLDKALYYCSGMGPLGTVP